MKIFQTVIVVISILITINQSIADSEQSEVSLDSITVTANKQEENIQDVPTSITAFDELILDDKNIDSVGELTDYVPNLILTYSGISGFARPAMRGILAQSGSGVSTAMFIDGIPVLSGYGYDDTLQNIERIEVLRGPQGTLYGKSAEAGVINIITLQPDNTFRGKVSVDGGEDYKKDVSLNVSGPIIQDKLFFGLSAQYYEKDGFIKNGYTGDEADNLSHWYGKGQLRWTPIRANACKNSKWPMILALSTSHANITSSKYCVSIAAFNLFDLMLPLKLLFSLSRFKAICRIAAKFSGPNPFRILLSSSRKAISNTQ